MPHTHTHKQELLNTIILLANSLLLCAIGKFVWEKSTLQEWCSFFSVDLTTIKTQTTTCCCCCCFFWKVLSALAQRRWNLFLIVCCYLSLLVCCLLMTLCVCFRQWITIILFLINVVIIVIVIVIVCSRKRLKLAL